MTNNWDAYSHRTLYDMIHGRPPEDWDKITALIEGQELGPGAGVAGAEAALQTWGELAALMDQARAATELALRDAGAHWEGAAAEAMQSGVTPLAQWAADANTAGAATQTSVDGHVASFSSAQHRMPEPVPVATGMPTTFPEIFAGQTDQDRQDAAAQEAKGEAVRVMTGYEGESTAAATSVGTFVPPPSVTVQVPPANPVGGEIGGAFVGPAGGSDGGGGTRAGTPDSAGSDAGGAPDAADDAQTTTPGQVVPIGGATPTPGTQPDQVTQRSTTPTSSVLSVGPGPIGAPRNAGGGSRAPGGPGGVTNPGPGAVPSPGRGGGVPGSPSAAGVRGGAGPTVARGFAGTSMVPLGGAVGPTKGDPDRDHKPPAYLRDTHDDFWDDTPPVSPPVIGEEEE